MTTDNRSKAQELRAMAARLLSMAAELEEPGQAPEHEKVTSLELFRSRARPGSDAMTAATFAEAVFLDRQRRPQYFPDVPFSDPAWDLLLDLFYRTSRGEKVTVTNACMAAGVPASTALRWIDVLIDHGLARREADSTDRRRTLLTLTDETRTRFREYFSNMIVIRKAEGILAS